jgi:hypothetical protein
VTAPGGKLQGFLNGLSASFQWSSKESGEVAVCMT